MIALVLLLHGALLATPAARTVDVVGPTLQWQPSTSVQTAPASATPNGAFPLLPVRTPEISPGVARGTLRLARPLPAPLCVVGADAGSLQWLAARSAALTAAQIACWVVNVEDARAWTRLRQAAGRTVLLPMSGGVLVEMGLRATPALIQRDGRIEGLAP